LQTFLTGQLKNDTRFKLLLLTDGYFDHVQLRAFSSWSSRQSNLMICTVAIGVDADESCCKKISCNGQVFAAHDIVVALDTLTLGLNGNSKPPSSVEALHVGPDNSVDEDDWA
jgi:hypothetical protein